MSSTVPGSSEFDLEQLDEFLMSDDSPEDCLQISDLDGFLAGVVVGPEPIMPSEWMPKIWGGDGPEFESEDQANQIIGAIIGRYNQIAACVAGDPDAFDPIFWKNNRGDVIAADWAEGFMEAVYLRPQAWDEIFEDEDGRLLMVPILACISDDEGNPVLDADAEELEKMHREAADMIAPSVMAIASFYRERQQETPVPSRPTPKTGRNDPCPCGSGKKYKRCCGAN